MIRIVGVGTGPPLYTLAVALRAVWPVPPFCLTMSRYCFTYIDIWDIGDFANVVKLEMEVKYEAVFIIVDLPDCLIIWLHVKLICN